MATFLRNFCKKPNNKKPCDRIFTKDFVGYFIVFATLMILFIGFYRSGFMQMRLT